MAQTVRAVESRRSSAEPAAARSAPAPAPSKAASAGEGGRQPSAPVDPAELKAAFLDEIRKQKKFFHGTVVAQAQRIDLQSDAITFVFAPQHRALRVQFDQMRGWLEETATRLAGRKMNVVASESASPADHRPSAGAALGDAAPVQGAAAGPDRTQELKERALADNGVQAMLDVFAAEIKDIEEM